ncbi:MAG: ABC transporter substrate-binding protein [Alphaproteobacteria bacterium]|nr:ABC transporter substrate-binding protein [Alphaproteobacteria bacterium]
MGTSNRLAVAASVAALILSAEAGAQQMSAVTQLGWLRNGEYAPIMLAEAKGYFKEAGIDHKIVDGGPGKNPIPIVAVGQAQFGLATNGMTIVTARLAKDPVDIVAVGTLFQQAPTSYISIAAPDAPPSKPRDMEGKTVGVQVGTEFLFHAFARKAGIDESKVKLTVAQATLEPLLVGKMDYFLGWIVNQTYQVEQEAAKPDAPPTVKGKSWRAIQLSDWGVRTYTDTIFTSAETLKKNPELVKRYLAAVQKGMQFELDHPDEAVEILSRFPGQTEDAKKLAWRFKLQNALFQSDYAKQHGLLTMDPAVWSDMIGFLKDGEQIPKAVPVSEVMTNDFFAKK